MGFRIKIENVVASSSFGVKIKLEKIVSSLPDIEYEPEQFPGLVMRLKDPKVAALIFSSGKIVCTGAKSPKDAKVAIGKIVKRLNKLKFKIPLTYKVKLENLVASAKLDQLLNLDMIAFALDNTEYEPEQFPGLVFRMTDPKVTFLLFGSGKIICTGGKTIADVKRAVAKVDIILKELAAKHEREKKKLEREKKKKK